MKKNAFLIVCCLACLLCQSCKNEESEPIAGPAPSLEGTLLDGGEIAGISLFCIENNKSMNGEPWYEYYPKTKTVADYDSFRLILMLNRNASISLHDDINEMTAIDKIEEDKGLMRHPTAPHPHLFDQFSFVHITCFCVQGYAIILKHNQRCDICHHQRYKHHSASLH